MDNNAVLNIDELTIEIIKELVEWSKKRGLSLPILTNSIARVWMGWDI